MKLTYAQQLRHPNWQRRRLEVLSQNNFQCSECGSKDKTLNVHHKRYVKGRQAWEYSDAELQVLCEDCHADEHAYKEIIESIIDRQGTGRIMALLVGTFNYAATPGEIDEAIEANDQMFMFGIICHLISMTSIKDMERTAEAIVHASGNDLIAYAYEQTKHLLK